MDVLDKVRKLLRLAESPNANEAASAAAKAQQLIDEHNLSSALLAIETDDKTDEPIEEFDALDRYGKSLARWKSVLAVVVSRANACKVYKNHGRLSLVGRASDAEVVRYMYGYLVHEVDRLCKKDGRGNGTIWRNNYRLGVVDTIREKLAEQKEKFVDSIKNSQVNNPMALVKVDQALVRIEQKSQSLDVWVKKNLRLKASYSRYTSDQSARDRGREAGKSISLNRSRGAITT